MTYVLISYPIDSFPEVELFSELPTMEFKPTEHPLDTEKPYTQCPDPMVCADSHIRRYDLYEGNVDGGDARDIPIMRCMFCGQHRALVSTKVTRGSDPTSMYTLTCGCAPTMAGC